MAEDHKLWGTSLQRLSALVERERRTRFSGGVFAGIWAFAMPVGWIVLIVLAFQLLGRRVPIAVPIPYFVASGILPYAMFRQIVSSLMRSVIANRYLIHFPGITLRQILLSSALAELFNLAVTSVVILGGIMLIYDVSAPADPLLVMAGLSVAWALGFGLGRLAALLGLWSDTAYRVVPLMLRPMFWISAIFYVPRELSATIGDILWFNPLVHAIEILREGLFLDYKSTISDPWYPLLCAYLLFIASSWLERYVVSHGLQRHRI